MPQARLNIVEARRKIVGFIREKVAESRSDGVVVGISGGVDSAVVAYLAVEALGNRRVLGLMMPDMRVTPEEDVLDAKGLAEELCIDAKLLDIAPIHRAFMRYLEPNRLAEGNLRARIRMSLLYYYANSTNRLVAGTGDRSEALVGYFTKYGDGGVDILPIGDLYKTEVRRMGEVLGLNRRIVSKRSSPRLWQGQTAEGELGVAYETVDAFFGLYLDQKVKVTEIRKGARVSPETAKSLLARYRESKHKRGMPEVCRVH